jgi:hypothetical protein
VRRAPGISYHHLVLSRITRALSASREGGVIPLSRLKFNRSLQRIPAAGDRAIAPAAGLPGLLLAEIPPLAWANRFRLDRQVSH